MAKRGGIVITPKHMIAQWSHAVHKFQLNVWNVEAELAKEAVDIFKKSFDLKRLNTKGSTRWPERTRKYNHPLMEETGTLKNSIEWKHLPRTGGNGGVRIYTNPGKFGTAARHPGFCYAAVHNAPSGSYTYGKTGVPSKQRQFIGHSSELDQKVKSLSVKIFAGLP